MTTLKLANKNKPTPKFWKLVGRILVWAMPAVSASILVLPLPLILKGVLIVGSNLLLAAGKELTTYTFDPNDVPVTYDSKKEVPK